MRIVFESFFCYWCFVRFDVCCVWVAHLRLWGPSISLTLHSGRQHTSVCRRLCFCLLCIGCTSSVRGSFDYRSGRQGKIRGSFGYAQDDIGVRLRLREVFRFCWRCTQDDTGEKEHVALSGTQVESNGS